MIIKDNLYTESGWEVYEKCFIAADLVTTGSNFLTGNGYLGYRGTFPEWGRHQYAACIVTDTYDNADGKWSELCNAPNALYTRLIVDGEELNALKSQAAFEHNDYYRGLNLRCGVLSRKDILQGKNGAQLIIKTEQFASYDNLHIIPLLYSIEAVRNCRLEVITGIDGRVWDLNGKHLCAYEMDVSADHLAIKAKTQEKQVILSVTEGHTIRGKEPLESMVIREEELIARKLVFDLAEGEKVTLEKVMVVYSSNDCAEPSTAGLESLGLALDKGYHTLLEEHKKHWDIIWEKADIIISDDLFSQVLLRFNLYHNIIATPMHTDHLPIGARGLSCQAYQGSAFWDQELFNLPMFLYTMPAVARNVLTYRYKTLSGARRKAAGLGYRGAFYAWVSGKSGDELCPSFFFKDVLTGRDIRNHFNDWQIHVSPDIAYSVCIYYHVTGDWSFIEECGAEIVFEVARFLYSHAYFKRDKNRYEFIRLLGPDEYHENVDNNAFTNYMARFTLDEAIAIYDRLGAENRSLLQDICTRIGLTENEYDHWKDMAALLYLPEPNSESGLLEQFDGYFNLEDVTPCELEKRLIDKGEYWGWPNGVAVHTQVIKQADVIQLFVQRNIFSAEIVKANYDYYEPRNQHGSSLSPAMHAIIAAKIGYPEAAYNYFIRSSTIDLFDTNKAVSGGTFIGGIHTAACGAAWQIVVFGFAGMEQTEKGLLFKPSIPEHWGALSFKIVFRGQELQLQVNNSEIIINSTSDNTSAITITAFEKTVQVSPASSALLQ